MISHTGSVKIVGGKGPGSVKELSSARSKKSLGVVAKHMCSDGGLISILPAPEFEQGSISSHLMAKAAPHHDV